MRRAHRPSRSDPWPPGPSPWSRPARVPPDPLLHAVRSLQGPQEGRRCSQAHPHRAGRGGGPWGLGGLRRVRPRARYPQTVATWERAQAGSRRSQSFPPMLRRVVSPPLAREVPPPPTLLSPRATNCARATKNRGHYSPPTRPQLNYCGQRTRNSDERAQERDKDQGKPASKRTAPPRLIQGQLTTNCKTSPRPTHHRLPRPDHPLPLTRIHRKNDRLDAQARPWGPGPFCD